MEDLSIRNVNYDYDESTQELLQFLKREKATYGIDTDVVGQDYFKTEFRVPDNPAEVKQFVAPDSIASGGAAALKDKGVGSLIQNLQKDDYYLIHFPLIIDTQFPFDHIELKVWMEKEQPGLYFVNTFPEPKDKKIIDGKVEGSLTATTEGGISISALKKIKDFVPAHGSAGIEAKNTFSLTYNWPFSIKKSIIERNGGNNTWTVKWIFKRAPDGGGLDSTLENITLLMKKPKQSDFPNIKVSGIGSRRYRFWPDWMVKLFNGLPLEKSPRIKTLVDEGFTVKLNKGKEVIWKAQSLTASQ